MTDKLAYILEKFAKMVEYDPDQKEFSFSSNTFTYDAHQVCKNIQMLVDEYDESGVLSFVYSTSFFHKFTKYCTVTILDAIFSNELDKYKEYLDLISYDYKPILREFSDRVAGIASKLAPDLIASSDGLDEIPDDDGKIYDFEVGDKIEDNLFDIVSGLKNLNVESLRLTTLVPFNRKKGAKIIKSVLVFDSIADMIEACKVYDMNCVFLAYITNRNTSGGYFTLTYSWDGNIVSVNDRVKESFRGQHKHSKNGRWQEGKAYSIFPYSLIKQAEENGYDYLGYAKNIKVDENADLRLSLLGEDIFNVVLLMLIFSLKFSKTNYFTFIPRIYSEDSIKKINGLTFFEDKHALSNGAFISSLSPEDILQGLDVNNSYQTESSDLIEINRSSEVTYPARYADGFNLTYDSMIQNHVLAIEDNADEDVNEEEFLGTYEEIDAQIFRDNRQKLFDHCTEKLAEEYREYGGYEQLQNWLMVAVLRNIDHVVRECREVYTENPHNQGWSMFSRSTGDTVKSALNISDECLNESKYIVFPKSSKCIVTGNHANVWFNFRFSNIAQIKHLIPESEIPDIIKNFNLDRDHVVNNLITQSDPMRVFGSPIDDTMRRHPSMQNVIHELHEQDKVRLRFSIGFSKAGLRKLNSDSSIVIKYNEEDHTIGAFKRGELI